MKHENRKNLGGLGLWVFEREHLWRQNYITISGHDFEVQHNLTRQMRSVRTHTQTHTQIQTHIECNLSKSLKA